jgi:hypothetical protein
VLPRLQANAAAGGSGGDAASVDPPPLQCTQEAGDLFFVPRGWGHAVLNLDTTIGYAREFNSPVNKNLD